MHLFSYCEKELSFSVIYDIQKFEDLLWQIVSENSQNFVQTQTEIQYGRLCGCEKLFFQFQEINIIICVYTKFQPNGMKFGWVINTYKFGQ